MELCKICGAPREPLAANCKFCDTAYQLNSITGETYINALSTILQHIDKSGSTGSSLNLLIQTALTTSLDAKISAISTFALPSDVENLLMFLAFCHGNAQMNVAFNDTGGNRIKGAWHGKAQMAFSQIKMKAIGNPAIAPYIAEYESIYGVKARKPLTNQAKTLFGAVAAMIVLGVFVGFMADGESKEKSKEKDRLDAIIQTVQKQLTAGQYDAAEASLLGVHWTWKPDYQSSERMAKVYDQRREEMEALILKAKNHSSSQ